MNLQPFLIGDGWVEVLDGNDTVRAIFDRHYSRRRYRDGRKPKLFIGPGEKLVLLSREADAICAWRKEKHRFDSQRGVECVIFRREGGDLASDQLRAAMGVCWQRFPCERLFSFVDPRVVPPTMVRGHPVWGFCFYKAGWRFAGLTAKGLHILEKKVPA
ncbi:hypothetical protein [Mesorhizobium sp.]|uniref:hypothetical protein n=1 Tax=Mesorhizobium sp. TaxID=1871066 RepID=UPI002580D54C|nr:hypothetical protein [Mesorhizobium sp.]